jgi:hypothetical protein
MLEACLTLRQNPVQNMQRPLYTHNEYYGSRPDSERSTASAPNRKAAPEMRSFGNIVWCYFATTFFISTTYDIVPLLRPPIRHLR